MTTDPAVGEAAEEVVSKAAEQAVGEAAEETVRKAVEEEVGDLLFAAVNVARLCSVAPGPALSKATEKFERRFGELLSRARRHG